MIKCFVRSAGSTVILFSLQLFAEPALSGSRNLGQIYEVTFVEVQTHTVETGVQNGLSPGISIDPSRATARANQINRIALTFRTNDQVDFERERNVSLLGQEASSDLAAKHILRGTSGQIGEWFPIAQSPFRNAKLRVTASQVRIDVEYHVSNFTQVFEITVDKNSCSAKIAYRLDQGQTVFLTSLHAQNNFQLTSMRADNIKCSVKPASFF